jgi:hypothetical protein
MSAAITTGCKNAPILDRQLLVGYLERGPSRVVGFVFVPQAVEQNLRSWSGRPVSLTG